MTTFTDADKFVNTVTSYVRRTANGATPGSVAVHVVVTKSDGATKSFKLSPTATPRPAKRVTARETVEKQLVEEEDEMPTPSTLLTGSLSFVTRTRLARDFFYALVDNNPRADSITNELSEEERSWLHVLRNYDVNLIVKLLGRDWTYELVIDFGREIHVRGFAAYNAASSPAEARQAAITWHKQFLQAWLSLDEVAECNHCQRVKAACASQ